MHAHLLILDVCVHIKKKKQRRQYLNINWKLSRIEGRSRYSHVGTETNGQKSKDKDDVHLSTFYYFFCFCGIDPQALPLSINPTQ